MSDNNTILNRFFTQNVFMNILQSPSCNNAIYATVVQRYVDDSESKDNGTLISEIYNFMSKSYRNEYFYQNTLLNKLLLGRHSVKTTTALTQIPIGKSKADFILINGKGVVYEIKTELDTFERLKTQIFDYYKGFNHVCVVTSEAQYEQAKNILNNTPVGIYVLTSQNRISLSMRKEPDEYNALLNHTAIFKLLHKIEFEDVLLRYYGQLPNTSQVFYFGECLKQFTKIPIMDAYTLALQQLKKRNRIETYEFSQVPYELKSLFYFSNSSRLQWESLHDFLNTEYGG